MPLSKIFRRNREASPPGELNVRSLAKKGFRGGALYVGSYQVLTKKDWNDPTRYYAHRDTGKILGPVWDKPYNTRLSTKFTDRDGTRSANVPFEFIRFNGDWEDSGIFYARVEGLTTRHWDTVGFVAQPDGTWVADVHDQFGREGQAVLHLNKDGAASKMEVTLEGSRAESEKQFKEARRAGDVTATATMLQNAPPHAMALVPDHGAPNGFRTLHLGPQHQNGFACDAGMSPGYTPHKELLAQVGKQVPHRVALVPEVFSRAAGRNVRFAAILPEGFDPNRKQPYDVVTFTPGKDAEALQPLLADEAFRPALQKFLEAEGAPDAIVLVPEGLEGGAADAALEQDLIPWVKSNLRGDEAAVGTYELGQVASPLIKSRKKREAKAEAEALAARSRAEAEAAEAQRAAEERSRLQAREHALTSTVASLRTMPEYAQALAPERGHPLGFRHCAIHQGYQQQAFRMDPNPSQSSAPDPELLERAGRELPWRVALLPELHAPSVDRNVRFAAFLPVGFDPAAAKSYPVISLLPEGADPLLGKVFYDPQFRPQLQRFLDAKGLGNAVVLIPEGLERADAMKAIKSDVLAYAAEHLHTQKKVVQFGLESLKDGADAAPLNAARVKAAQTTQAKVEEPAAQPESKQPRAPRAAVAESAEAPQSTRITGQGLAPDVRADLDAVVQRLPQAAPLLETLIEKRPELFQGEDSVTHKSFAAQLRVHTERYLSPEDRPGFLDFLRRLDDREIAYRWPGYSHSGPVALTTLANHPGLLLDLIEASRDGRDYRVPHLYAGDGRDAIPPTRRFAEGFRTGNGGWFRGAAPQYERAFIEAVVDVLRPDRLPADRLARRCDPVAVALARLTGQDLRYGWAFNLKTGDDLVAALASQGNEGLAMADVSFVDGDGVKRFCHFPVFYDYDPKDHTVAVQDWVRAPMRINVKGLRFPDRGDERPAIYYRADPKMEPFLTLDEMRAYYARGSSMRDARWGEGKAEESARQRGKSADWI